MCDEELDDNFEAVEVSDDNNEDDCDNPDSEDDCPPAPKKPKSTPIDKSKLKGKKLTFEEEDENPPNSEEDEDDTTIQPTEVIFKASCFFYQGGKKRIWSTPKELKKYMALAKSQLESDPEYSRQTLHQNVLFHENNSQRKQGVLQFLQTCTLNWLGSWRSFLTALVDRQFYMMSWHTREIQQELENLVKLTLSMRGETTSSSIFEPNCTESMNLRKLLIPKKITPVDSSYVKSITKPGTHTAISSMTAIGRAAPADAKFSSQILFNLLTEPEQESTALQPSTSKTSQRTYFNTENGPVAFTFPMPEDTETLVDIRIYPSTAADKTGLERYKTMTSQVLLGLGAYDPIYVHLFKVMELAKKRAIKQDWPKEQRKWY